MLTMYMIYEYHDFTIASLVLLMANFRLNTKNTNFVKNYRENIHQKGIYHWQLCELKIPKGWCELERQRPWGE